MLADLVVQNILFKKGKSYSLQKASLPLKMQVVEITLDGDVFVKPIQGPFSNMIFQLTPSKKGARGDPFSAFDVGDVVLAKMEEKETIQPKALLLKKIPKDVRHIIGIFHKRSFGGVILPATKKDRSEYVVEEPFIGDAEDGDLVEAELAGGPYRLSRAACIKRVLGSTKAPRSLSLIAIHNYDLPHLFSPEALALAKKAKIPPLKDREDLRSLPLVTIDDEDARDFDDAVWAEADPDPANPGGWHLLVAIADVSYYVTPGDPLDEDAYKRGNSVYFPDQVIPMLPEALSNDLCSLRPREDRGCLAVHLWINQDGRLLRTRFTRGLMRSAERLTYRLAQAAFEGGEHPYEKAFVQSTIVPLYGAYAALKRAREKRGTLDLDLPEERIYLDEKGRITRIEPRLRLESHKLIEEFMILANVAAACFLVERKMPCMFRVHDQPTPEKVSELRNYLQSLNFSFRKGQGIKPIQFTQILRKVRDTPYAHAIHALVLRTQAQAAYSPQNIGHFGLNLPQYAHFTSPIRRYADLLVHRAICHALDGNTAKNFPYQQERFLQIGEHISNTERKAAAAEREMTERYVAAYLETRIGDLFPARINGVTEFALFVTFEKLGADAIIPLRFLNDDYYRYDAPHHRLIGRRTKKIYAIGDALEVKLLEANTFSGSLIACPAHMEKRTFTEQKRHRKKPFQKEQRDLRKFSQKAKKKP